MNGLGICIVFLVRDTDADGYALLDACIERIARHTRGPYRLYGSCPDGDAGTLRRLHEHGVTIVPVAGRHPHISQEHSMLLDRLVDRAVADGCTHVATLDMDSWPVHDGWDGLYADAIDARAPVAAIVRTELGDNFPFAAFTFLPATFWRVGESSFSTEQRATFAAADADASSRPGETGSGILAQLRRDGQQFLRLERSNRWDVHPLIAGLYDGTIFHLGAGSRQPVFVIDEQTYALNGSPLRRRFADYMNAQLREFALRQVLAHHDEFVDQLAGGAREPLVPIRSDPRELPKSMSHTPVGQRTPWPLRHDKESG